LSTTNTAVFTGGAISRHVIYMTATASIGLVALFIVDALNLFYIAQLGEAELAAAVGYAGTLLFFVTSLAIGLAIAGTAIVSRTLGSGQAERARAQASAALVLMGVIMSLSAVALAATWQHQLYWLGARGHTAELAYRFLILITPSLPLLGLGMALAGILRAFGDGRRAMWVTLGPALIAAILDPLFILGLDLSLDGAALVSNTARLVMVWIGWRALTRHHGFSLRLDPEAVQNVLRPYMVIGLPAVMTQLATPFGNAFVTNELANHGDAAVAGWAIIGRLIPVAFGVIFALSGAIGPIVGQNYGAQRFDRLRDTVSFSLKMTIIYVVLIWLIMSVSANYIASAFNASAESREMIVFFCRVVALSFLFNGMVFVANAVFNNLGLAFYSTLLNWSRATLGVLPFVWIGSHYAGSIGVLAGYGLGAIVFGIGGYWVCWRVIQRIEAQAGV